MKKITLIIMMFVYMSIFSQERTLIKNEMQARSGKTELNVERYRRGNNSSQDKATKGVMNNNRRTVIPRYVNNRFEGAEMRLSILDYGFYAVEINNQMMVSPYGKFHFFDLPMGRNLLSIYEDGYLIYQANIIVQNNRVINLEFQKNAGLFEVFSSIGIGQYNGNYYPAEISQSEYNDMIRYINRTSSFDDDRLRSIRTMAMNRYFSASQVAGLMRLLSFDKNRLVLAKEMYNQCVNPQMYYEVVDILSYTSSKRELEKFIQQQGRRR